MFVCICNPVTDREIRGCVREGACTLSDLQLQLGVAVQCGMCASSAEAIIQEETAMSRAPAQARSAALLAAS
jgi:bacterioferritin-associated ferredoxin